jgi:enoyl-CoA hydratase/carnithine racemase
MPDAPIVIVERRDAVGELVLNRPERRNAITGPLVDALQAGLEELIADDEVRVIVIRGADGTFCAGNDLKEFRADPRPDWLADHGQRWAGFHAALFGCPKPIIGALEGHAIAAGSALALACDFLIAGEEAQLHVAEVALGLGPAPVNMVWLEWKYGAGRAQEFVTGGLPYTGRALANRGMALRAVPDDLVVEETHALAARLAENSGDSMAQAKALVRRLSGVPDAEAFRKRIELAQQR